MPEEQPYWFGSVVRWFAWTIPRYGTEAKLAARYAKRFAGMEPWVYQAALQQAENLLAIKERYPMLGSSMPLSDILLGQTAPGPQTYANFRVAFTRYDIDGDPIETVWREVQWRGLWGTTRAEIDDYVRQKAETMLQTTSPVFGETFSVSSIELDSTIWYQHPQQL